MNALEDLEKRGDVHFIADTCSHQPSFLILNKLKEAAIWDKSLLMGKYVSWWWGICWKMGGDGNKEGEVDQEEPNCKKKSSVGACSLSQSQVSQVCLGEKEEKFRENNWVWPSTKIIFIPKLLPWGFSPLALCYLLY